MFMKKSLFLFLGALAVGGAQGIVTNYWAGSSGGNWSNTANWTAKNPDGSTAAVDVAAERVYDFSALASGQTVTCDVANVIPKEIVFSKIADGDTWTLAATKNLNIKKKEVAVTVPAGCTLNYGLRVPNGYGDSIMLTFTGGGQVNFNSPSFSPYCMRMILDHTKLTVASTSAFAPVVVRLVGDDARLTLQKSVVLLGLESAEGNPTVDIGSMTLWFKGGYEGWQKFSYDGSIVGTGSVVVGGGVMQSFTRPNALSRSLKLLNGDMTFATGAPYAGSTVEIAANGRFVSSNDQTVVVLKGAGISGGVDIPDGKTFTVKATADNTFAGSLEGAGSFVKDGSAALKLTGASTHDGGTRVQAGTLELASWATATRLGAANLSSTALYLDFSDPADLLANRSTSGLAFDAQTAYASVNGKVGSGVSMPGNSGTRLSTATRDLLTDKGKSAYTISTWLCPDESVNSVKYNQIFLRGRWEEGTGAAQLSWLAIYGVDDKFYLRTATTNATDGAKYDRSFTIPKPDATKPWGQQGWFHVAVTYGNHRRIAYVNGVEVARDASDIPDVSELNNVVTIGGEYKGYMDEFIYDVREWSADEVKAEYERTAGVLSEARDGAADLPQPVAHYAFDDAANPGKDSSGNGYDLVNPGSVYCPNYDNKGTAKTVTSRNVNIVENIPNTYGKCGSFAMSALRYPESAPFPAKIPTGNAAFSISVRYQMSRSMGPSLVEWGDNTVANHYVRLCNGASPATPRVEFAANGDSHGGGVSPNFSSVLRDYTILPGAQRGERVTWTHVIWTYEPTAQRFTCYYDGVACATDNATKALPFDIQATNLVVGCCSRTCTWGSDSEKFFTGYIDDIRIYDCVLTADQAMRLTRSMQTGSIPATLPTGSAVTVDAGATLKVSQGADHAFASIAGTGTLDVSSALARVTVTGGGTVAAVVRGVGALRASGADLSLTGDLSAFVGDLEATNAALTVSTAASNAVIRVLAGGRVTGETLAAKAVLPEDLVIFSDATGSTLPIVQTKGTVKIPTRAAFLFSCPIQEVTRVQTRLFPIATGRLNLPETFDGWAYTNPGGRYSLSFEVAGSGEVQTLYAKIKYGGLAVIIR